MKMNMGINWETRLCKVDDRLGYFHCFEQWSNGRVSQMYGIVEFSDGVERVNPTSIEFVDEENVFLCSMQRYEDTKDKDNKEIKGGKE